MSMKYILGVLFPYIVLLYLIDSIIYIRKNHFLFISRFRKYFKLKQSGLHLVGILPIDKAVVCQSLPLYFTTLGIYLPRDHAYQQNGIIELESLDFISYKDLSNTQLEGKNVRINKEKVIKTASSNIAKQIIKFVKDLKILDVKDRYDKIQVSLKDAINLREIQNITSIYLKYGFYLQILCSVLFICMFIILPLTLYTHLYLYINIYSLLFYMASIYLAILTVVCLLIRNLNTPKRQKLYTIISIILSPITAVHVLSNLTRESYLTYDYLAVAAELLPRSKFKYLFSCEFEHISILKYSSRDDLREYFLVKEKCLRDLLARLGITMEQLPSSPEKRDWSADSYCPVCRAEYRAGFTECSDCGTGLKRYRSEKTVPPTSNLENSQLR